MNLDPRALLAPVLALLLLLTIAAQTSDALKNSGAWGPRTQVAKTAPVDPYARLEYQLSHLDPGSPQANLRDPFTVGGVTTTVVSSSVPRRPPPPPPPSRPVLTAIVSDAADPRALIRYEDRNYSVKSGDLFAEFRVLSIDDRQVILDRSGERLVLLRPSKGE